MRKVSKKTDRASRANTASELSCVLSCPHNDINQDEEPRWKGPLHFAPGNYCLSQTCLRIEQTGDEGEYYSIVWGIQKQRVRNNTNETQHKALGPRSEGCVEKEIIVGDLDRTVAPQLHPGHEQFKMTFDPVSLPGSWLNRKARTRSTGRYRRRV